MPMKQSHDYSRRMGLTAAVCVFLLLFSGCTLFDSLKLPFSTKDKSSSEDQSLPEEDAEYPLQMAGAEILSRPSKVVSLAPSLTEKIYDLKMDDRLVGVSAYCDTPTEVKRLENCGTMLILDLEVIAKISPHLLITETTLAEEDMAALAEMGVAVAVLPHAASFDELCDIYETIAILLEGRVTGAEIGSSYATLLAEELAEISTAVAPFVGENKMPVLYLRLLDFTVATGDTLENDLLQAAGMINIAEEYSDWNYPQQSAQSDEGRTGFMAVKTIFCDENDITIKDLEQSSFYKGLPAVLQDWYFYIDAQVFERQSMRMFTQLREMAAYCYPDAALISTSSVESEAPESQDTETGTVPMDDLSDDPSNSN